MARINIITRLFFFVSVGMGLLGGIFDLYILNMISLIIIFLTLSFSSSCKDHQIAFLFPLIFLSSLSLNTRISMIFASLEYGNPLTMHSLLVFMLIFVSLISVEELVLGIIGLIIWGKQALIYYQHPFQMIQNDCRTAYYTRGYFPHQGTNNHAQRHLHKI